MAESQLAADGPGAIRVTGVLDFSTVAALSQSGAVLLAGSIVDGALRIDLSGVTRADSAGIALLLGWLRIAHQRGAVLQFLAVPEQMVLIAGTCGVQGLLGLDQAH